MKPFSRLCFLFFLCVSTLAQAQTEVLETQQGFGLRFASNINFFPRAREHALVRAGYTTGVFGAYYSSYTEKSGYEVGANIVYKNGSGSGFNLPVVMTDFAEGQLVGLTAVEMDLKVGPRFGAVHPKIGYIMGYRFNTSGWQIDGVNDEVNPLYLMLPFGISGIWPTNFGTVGIGGFYNIGILNVLKDPNPGNGTLYDGGRLRYINLELIVTYGRE